MKPYHPPFSLASTMLTYVSSISEEIGRIASLTNFESKVHLRKNNRIKSIHSSLKIEANSLSLSEVRDVINGKTVLGEKKEIQEVKNAYEAYEKLLAIDPYNIKHLKDFYSIMTRNILKDSGTFRSGEEGVFSGGSSVLLFQGF